MISIVLNIDSFLKFDWLTDQVNMMGDWKYGMMGLGEQYAMMVLQHCQLVLFVIC
jgi:hypothetical protein